MDNFPFRKFRNELPDPSAVLKYLSIKRDKDRFTKYKFTLLEKMHKPELYVEPDLGIPLDLLDLSVYNPPKGQKIPLDPEDEELLRDDDDDDPVIPIQKDGLKKEERPSDEGISWLVKTQYTSPLHYESSQQSLARKYVKALEDQIGGRHISIRKRKTKEIEASFEACKLPPVHATNKNLKPVEIMPLLPDFERCNDKFIIASFDSSPTVDSEIYSKLEKSKREALESKAIVKSCVATDSASGRPDKYLAYVVPSIDEDHSMSNSDSGRGEVDNEVGEAAGGGGGGGGGGVVVQSRFF